MYVHLKKQSNILQTLNAEYSTVTLCMKRRPPCQSGEGYEGRGTEMPQRNKAIFVTLTSTYSDVKGSEIHIEDYK